MSFFALLTIVVCISAVSADKQEHEVTVKLFCNENPEIEKKREECLAKLPEKVLEARRACKLEIAETEAIFKNMLCSNGTETADLVSECFKLKRKELVKTLDGDGLRNSVKGLLCLRELAKNL